MNEYWWILLNNNGILMTYNGRFTEKGTFCVVSFLKQKNSDAARNFNFDHFAGHFKHFWSISFSKGVLSSTTTQRIATMRGLREYSSKFLYSPNNQRSLF